jgi:hypothetical protein
MEKLLLLFAMLLSEGTQVQSFQSYMEQLPKINIPLEFNETILQVGRVLIFLPLCLIQILI